MREENKKNRLKKTRTAVSLLTAAALLAAVPVTAYGAGWKQDDKGSWYEREDGSYPKGGWEEIDGNWYRFNDQGYMQRGWYRDTKKKKKYWLGSDGKLLTSQVCKLDGLIYQIDENGVCNALKDYVGWVQEGDRVWYQNSRGSWPSSSWQEIDGERYHFDGSGYVQTGWFVENGVRYWLDESGKMVHDTTMVIDGVNYSFDASGVSSLAAEGM